MNNCGLDWATQLTELTNLTKLAKNLSLLQKNDAFITNIDNIQDQLNKKLSLLNEQAKGVVPEPITVDIQSVREKPLSTLIAKGKFTKPDKTMADPVLEFVAVTVDTENYPIPAIKIVPIHGFKNNNGFIMSGRITIHVPRANFADGSGMYIGPTANALVREIVFVGDNIVFVNDNGISECVPNCTFIIDQIPLASIPANTSIGRGNVQFICQASIDVKLSVVRRIV